MNECTQAGWFWYCDVHDTHGNADSKEEARFIADAHKDFMYDGPFDDGCDVTVFEIKEPEHG